MHGFDASMGFAALVVVVMIFGVVAGWVGLRRK